MENQEVCRSGYDNLMLVAQGHVAFHCLKAGLELGLFDFLDQQGAQTHAQIMQHLDIQEAPCKILVRALYSLNLLDKQGVAFSNTSMAQKYLTTSGGYKFLDILGWQDKIVYPAIVELKEAICRNKNVGLKHFPGHGDNLYERLSSHKDLELVFQKSMTGLSLAAHQAFFNQVDLSGLHTIVDVGGGEGTNLKALLELHPDKKGVVFDLPSVCELAQKNIQKWGLAERLSTHGGNLLTDDYPQGVDAFLFCHMFTIWSGDKITSILKKCHQALSEKGKVIVFNMMSHDDEYGPISCALGSPYFLAIATGEGKLHTTSEYQDWFQKAGFSQVEYFEGLPIDHGYFVASK